MWRMPRALLRVLQTVPRITTGRWEWMPKTTGMETWNQNREGRDVPEKNHEVKKVKKKSLS